MKLLELMKMKDKLKFILKREKNLIKGNPKLRRYTTIYTKTINTINSWEDYKTYGSTLLKQSNNKKSSTRP